MRHFGIDIHQGHGLPARRAFTQKRTLRDLRSFLAHYAREGAWVFEYSTKTGGRSATWTWADGELKRERAR